MRWVLQLPGMWSHQNCITIEPWGFKCWRLITQHNFRKQARSRMFWSMHNSNALFIPSSLPTYSKANIFNDQVIKHAHSLTRTHRHTHIYIFAHIYIYIYIDRYVKLIYIEIIWTKAGWWILVPLATKLNEIPTKMHQYSCKKFD